MAVYVQQMVGHDQILFPLDNCTIPMYKPPLYHWTAAALAALLGNGTATAVNLRLPSALYAVGAAILTMAFTFNLLGASAANLAGLILCSSYQYVSQARIGLVDMTLTFCETLALFSFFGWFALARGASDAAWRRTLMHYLLALAMGLGVLAKGPIGALLPGSAILLFLLAEDRTALLMLFKAGPLVLGIAIASSWYLSCFFGRRYNFLHLQIGVENFGRFFGSLGNMPAWYYVQPLLLNSLPLSLFVPLAVLTALVPKRSARPQSSAAPSSPMDTSPRSDARATDSDPASFRTTPSSSSRLLPSGDFAVQADRSLLATLAARLLAIFWVFSVAFFDFAAFKRRAYLLPLWPASAYLLAWWTMEHILPSICVRLRTVVYRLVITTCLLLATANFLFIPAYELHQCGAPFTLDSLLQWSSTGFMGESFASSNQTKSYRAAAAQINRFTPSDTRLYWFGFQDALEPLIFYLDRCALPLAASLPVPADAWVITPVSAWTPVRSRFPNLTPWARISYDHDALILLRTSGVATRPGVGRK